MDSALVPWLHRGIGFALGVTVVVALAVGLIAGANVVVLVFVAVLLGSAIRPPVDALRNTLPFGRTAATGLLFLLVAVLVIAIGVIVVSTAVSQAGEIGKRIPAMLTTARQSLDAQAPGPLRSLGDAFLGQVDRALQTGAGPTTDQVIGAGSAIAATFGAFTTVATLVFFWTHERARLQRFVLAFLPADRRAGTRAAWNDVEDRLGRWVRAQLTLMGLMGVATGIAYTVLGLPGALAVALAATLLEAIPIVGPLLGAIPALLVAAALRPDLVVAVVLVYAVIQLAEANVVVPVLMGNSVGLSPFIVLVAVLLGATLGGGIGAFLAVPIAASAEIVLQRLQARETPVTLESEPASTESAPAVSPA